MFFGIVIALIIIGCGVFLVWLPPAYRERMRNRSLRLNPEAWDVPLMRGAGALCIVVGTLGLITAIVTN